ncbi:MAG: hypothetical protein L6R37_005709 [Teloschistes peruensis]|nr:MAG: hypothetical protein L6R37_005709 [Teloschistes peruensis]
MSNGWEIRPQEPTTEVATKNPDRRKTGHKNLLSHEEPEKINHPPKTSIKTPTAPTTVPAQTTPAATLASMTPSLTVPAPAPSTDGCPTVGALPFAAGTAVCMGMDVPTEPRFAGPSAVKEV